MKREVIFFVEFVSLIILIIGYKLLVYVLKINNLALMNFPYFIFTGIFIVLSFLILIQIVIIIYTSVKSKILKGTIIITSIIGSIIFFLYSLLILAFMYNPEHIIEKENKKMNEVFLIGKIKKKIIRRLIKKVDHYSQYYIF